MIYYFPLESLKSRYTHQLSTKWMPNAFDKVGADWTSVDGNYEQGDVKVGMVLDAVGRGIYSMNQCKYFLELIQLYFSFWGDCGVSLQSPFFL